MGCSSQKSVKSKGTSYIKNSDIEKYETLSLREQLRKDDKFVPIEQMTKEEVYLQFLSFNDYLLEKKSFTEPFKWNDENVENKLIEAIKKADNEAQLMSDFVELKKILAIHPETMQMFIDTLQWGDYKWQLLKRLLLIYQTYKNIMDEETMKKMTIEKDESKKNK